MTKKNEKKKRPEDYMPQRVAQYWYEFMKARGYIDWIHIRLFCPHYNTATLSA